MSQNDPTSNSIPADDSDDWKIQRDASKLLGDQAFKTADYASAIQHYSDALSLDPDFCVGYSNRSAAYLKSGQKSKALHDAEKCVELGSMGAKGLSRLAAALQSLGRWEAALENWKKVLKDDANNAAAKKGVQDCQERVDKERKEQQVGAEPSDDVDELDDFFNDVEDAAAQVRKEKEVTSLPQATHAIKNQKKSLGTAKEQIERLLKENYQWRNLNPFFVMDVPHTATTEEISRRYKGLSLLLHPDKNSAEPNAQEAYDEVLKAKAMLDDENKANHCRQLVEKGMIIGQADWEARRRSDSSTSLEDCQSRAVQKIFAEIEMKRREVERRERQYEQRTKQQEDEEAQKEMNERKRDKAWKVEEHVDKRIGNWRDFANKKKPKL